MTWDLPTSVDIDGKAYKIRSDYRAILDICTALTDPELSEQERGYVVLALFYPDFDTIPPKPKCLEQAIERCFWFIRLGEEEPKKQQTATLVSWEQDFQYIVAPINRVAGHEIRADKYMHWWTFVGYYNEIGGDCTFAQIVRIRDKLSRHKKLDKDEQKWYRENRQLVDIKRTYTEAEHSLLMQMVGGKDG